MGRAECPTVNDGTGGVAEAARHSSHYGSLVVLRRPSTWFQLFDVAGKNSPLQNLGVRASAAVLISLRDGTGTAAGGEARIEWQL